jgi:hypothetical protein
MSSQDIATLTGALIGAIAAILAGVLTFLGTYIQQRMADRHEKSTIRREKIEAIYTGSNQVADWMALQVSTIEELLVSQLGNATGTGSGHSPGDGECPIETVITFISLYLPELRKKKDIAAYRATIKAMQALCKKINKNNNVVTQSDLTQAKQLHETFQQQNEALQSELEKLF